MSKLQNEEITRETCVISTSLRYCCMEIHWKWRDRGRQRGGLWPAEDIRAFQQQSRFLLLQ